MIFPTGRSPYQCGRPDAQTSAGMHDVNTFWNSGVVACAHGPDQPEVQGNAVSYGGLGYVYFDPRFLASLGKTSALPPVMVLAHEMGHEIQGRFRTRSGVSIRDELGADCYSGYFLGWLACNGHVSMADVQSTFAGTCAAGQNLPWWTPGNHGTCQQRVQALQRGILAFQNGVAPINACTF